MISMLKTVSILATVPLWRLIRQKFILKSEKPKKRIRVHNVSGQFNVLGQRDSPGQTLYLDIVFKKPTGLFSKDLFETHTMTILPFDPRDNSTSTNSTVTAEVSDGYYFDQLRVYNSRGTQLYLLDDKVIYPANCHKNRDRNMDLFLSMIHKTGRIVATFDCVK